jgi:hypothetical protein
MGPGIWQGNLYTTSIMAVLSLRTQLHRNSGHARRFFGSDFPRCHENAVLLVAFSSPWVSSIYQSFGGRMLWLCMLISSTAKWIVFKAGGWRSYRRLVPFFLGLVLGDFTMGSIWTLIGIALGIRTHDFWP